VLISSNIIRADSYRARLYKEPKVVTSGTPKLNKRLEAISFNIL
jgi:hypothetical protein